MKKRLLIMCPGANDATSFWRGVGPLAHLDKSGILKDWEMLLYKSKDIGWSDLIYFDVVFFHRPYSAAHIEMLKLAKGLGRKIWVDYDDDLTSIPYSNPAHNFYAADNIQNNLKMIAGIADIISVSTEALKKKYESLNKNVLVIQNAWNEQLSPTRRSNPSTSKVILWRGSATHDQDLDHYLPQMATVAQEHPDWKWVFVGKPYWKVTETIKSTMVVDPMDIPSYLKFISQIDPCITIVPLAPNEFNKSKSNIGWQEASFAGAVSVVPDWTEWQRDGAINYSSETHQSFYHTLKAAITLPYKIRQQQAAASWKHIMEKESLKVWNIKRAELLEGLVQ